MRAAALISLLLLATVIVGWVLVEDAPDPASPQSHPGSPAEEDAAAPGIGLTERGPIQPATLVIPSGPHRVRVRVVDGAGEPLGLRVFAAGGALAPASISLQVGPIKPDGAGRFLLSDLETGFLQFTVETKPGRFLSTTKRRVPRTDEIVILVPTERRTITGAVFDAKTGRLVEAAEVRWNVRLADGALWQEPKAVTDAGRFTAAVPPGVCSVYVTADGYRNRNLQVEDPAQPVRVDLAPKAQLTGRVLDHTTGEPVAGAKVHIRKTRGGRVLPSYYASYYGTDSSESDSEGRFAITLDRHERAMVFVCGGGWVSHGLAVVQEEGVNPFILTDLFEQGRDLELRVEEAGSVRVLAVDAQGNAVPACALQLWQTNWVPDRMASYRLQDGPPLSSWQNTDAEGRALFEDLVPGWRYEFVSGDWSAWTVPYGEAKPILIQSGVIAEARCLVEHDPSKEEADAEEATASAASPASGSATPNATNPPASSDWTQAGRTPSTRWPTRTIRTHWSRTCRMSHPAPARSSWTSSRRSNSTSAWRGRARSSPGGRKCASATRA